MGLWSVVAWVPMSLASGYGRVPLFPFYCLLSRRQKYNVYNFPPFPNTWWGGALQ